MLKSLLAVVVGYVLMAALVMATVFGLYTLLGWQEGDVPSTPALVGLAVAGGIYACIGGFVTALLAPRAPFVHALALGGVVLGLWFLDAGSSPLEVPTWFQVTVLFTGVFGALCGGALGSFRRTRRALASG